MKFTAITAGVLFTGIMVAGSQASASDITYDLIIDGSNETGTITTDGKIGTLSTSDIVSFSFSGLAIFTGTTVDVGVNQNNADLTTTATGLYFNFSDPSNSVWFFSNEPGGIGTSQSSLDLTTSSAGGGFIPEDEFANKLPETGTVEIAAIAATPLPGSLSLLLTGAIGAFAFVNRKKLSHKSHRFAA